MLSTTDLERLIATKRREIEKEKTHLGLSAPNANHNNKEYDDPKKSSKQVNSKNVVVSERKDAAESRSEKDRTRELYDLEEHIPPDLERYIRRYIGLPVMLKAGEYSPNNPLIRAERTSGDVLLALGEYERRRNTLRRLRQQQYKDYLDQQAKKKQEDKEQAEKERREREEKERQREERERERLLLERERRSPVRRPSLNYSNVHTSTKVDTGVQVTGLNKPLSVAVQTDDAELYRVSPWSICGITQAERELSPRAASEHAPLDKQTEKPIREQIHKPIHEQRDKSSDQPIREPIHKSIYEPRDKSCDQSSREPIHKSIYEPRDKLSDQLIREPIHRPIYEQREKSCDQSIREPIHKPIYEHRGKPNSEPCRERRNSRAELPLTAGLKKSNQDKLLSDLRHSYMPSIFDADAIQLRNLQTEKEAAERRQFYQQELKNQIMEQQRIKEERKSREKLLEQAEMRRLEEQLRMLRVAQDREIGKQIHIDNKMTENTTEYNNKRRELQKDIDSEQHKLRVKPRKKPSADQPTKLPPQYPKEKNKKPYSINISDNSLFSPDYDVDSYLRRNLNYNTKEDKNQNYLTDKDYTAVDDSIPVLKHSPIVNTKKQENNNLSEAMKKIDAKWKVPAVQKNILKSMPNDEGKNVSILTQLGSIRRQLQLEQLKLDQMLPQEDA